ncbi:hypothetical protein ACFWG5_34280 [Streptomyces hydrogenans]|uniref:hypothetical protein n=1 Tax=Streptomyces TaxID=1883 RepID=UPI00363FCAE1
MSGTVPKTPKRFTETFLRSAIEADKLASENINDRWLREAHTHSAVNGYAAAVAIEMLRRHNPDVATAIAEHLEQVLTAGDLAGPTYRTAQGLGFDPDQWLAEHQERAQRRKEQKW